MAIWNEASPSGNDLVSDFPSNMTTHAVAFRQGIEQLVYWTQSSGASAGIPAFGASTPPGGFRAFFAPESSLSTALSTTKPLAGRLFIASDTSRLYGFTSAGTVLLGGKNFIVFVGGSLATIPSNTRVLVQTGAFLAAQGVANSVVFPTAYSTSTPVVQLQVMSSSTTYLGVASMNTPQITKSGFTLWTAMAFGSSSSLTVLWRSTGTVTL